LFFGSSIICKDTQYSKNQEKRKEKLQSFCGPASESRARCGFLHQNVFSFSKQCIVMVPPRLLTGEHGHGDQCLFPSTFIHSCVGLFKGNFVSLSFQPDLDEINQYSDGEYVEGEVKGQW
jgi:hypothetical protein